LDPLATNPPVSPPLWRLYHEHKDAVFNAAFHLLGERAGAEDVLQDVFVALVRQGHSTLRQPRAWLLTATLNRVRDRVRQRQAAAADLDDLPSASPGPLRVAEQQEQAQLVAAALATLPLPQREVVVLHVFEGLSFAAIGELCGVSQDTAASRWRYACDKLRARLAAVGGEPAEGTRGGRT
jgi:RNA polymerase sigma-70 factor (ECF subfamily)